MAQNRLNLKCRKCGDEFTIARCAGTDWVSSRIIDQLDDWLEKHQMQCGQPNDAILKIELVSEGDWLVEIHNSKLESEIESLHAQMRDQADLSGS